MAGAQTPKLVSLGFSQRVWTLILAKVVTKRDGEFVHISRHLTKILRHGGRHEADGTVRWDHVLTNMPSAEQTQYWDKEEWIDALGRSAEKPRIEYCEDQNGTIIYIRAVQGHSHGARINPTVFSSTKIPLNWKEHLSINHRD